MTNSYYLGMKTKLYIIIAKIRKKSMSFLNSLGNNGKMGLYLELRQILEGNVSAMRMIRGKGG